MTNKQLLNKVNQLEDLWYYDTKGSLFEDTDVLIYNEDTDTFDKVNEEELRKELQLLINDYFPSGIQEEEGSKELYTKWINILSGFYNSL